MGYRISCLNFFRMPISVPTIAGGAVNSSVATLSAPRLIFYNFLFFFTLSADSYACHCFFFLADPFTGTVPLAGIVSFLRSSDGVHPLSTGRAAGEVNPLEAWLILSRDTHPWIARSMWVLQKVKQQPRHHSSHPDLHRGAMAHFGLS